MDPRSGCRWERRRLAFEVKGRREGYYVVMNFDGEPALESELNRVFGDNTILVHENGGQDLWSYYWPY